MGSSGRSSIASLDGVGPRGASTGRGAGVRRDGPTRPWGRPRRFDQGASLGVRRLDGRSRRGAALVGNPAEEYAGDPQSGQADLRGAGPVGDPLVYLGDSRSAVVSDVIGDRESDSMRIIAGIRRGHTIQGPRRRSPPGRRATSCASRSSTSSAPMVEGRPVLDLFAGTGALGLEALSRGATAATFVESKGQNAALIRRNLAALRFEGMGEVIVANAYAFVKQFEPPCRIAGPMTVFLDPPYREYEQHPSRIRSLFETLVGRLPDGSTIVAEAGRSPVRRAAGSRRLGPPPLRRAPTSRSGPSARTREWPATIHEAATEANASDPSPSTSSPGSASSGHQRPLGRRLRARPAARPGAERLRRRHRRHARAGHAAVPPDRPGGRQLRRRPRPRPPSGRRGRGRDLPQRRGLRRRPSARVGRLQHSRAGRRAARLHHQRHVLRPALRRR